MYAYAKAYYEKYGNLEIPYSYSIKLPNEEKPINLGKWIRTQRTAYKNEELIKQGKSPKDMNRISEEQIELFNALGMRWLPKKEY